MKTLFKLGVRMQNAVCAHRCTCVFRLSLIKLLLLAALIFNAGQACANWHEDVQSIMGTEVRLHFWLEDEAQALAAQQAVMDEMRRIDTSLSPYIETSELAQLNANAAKSPVKVSNELMYLINRSIEYSELSAGAFDITFASVAWHYDYRKSQQPNNEQRNKLLPAINYHWLVLDHQQQTVFFNHENVRIDLGGIAKGYAVDRAAEILAQFNVKSATVSAGGDSRIIGDKLGKPWLIGIKNPRPSERSPEQVVLTLPLSNVAVSTSGDYERFFIDPESGERVHHIINPKTGQSAKQIMSVTVIGEAGIDTDALSTTVFVLGVEKGLKLINDQVGIDAIIIDSKGKVHYSQGLTTPD